MEGPETTLQNGLKARLAQFLEQRWFNVGLRGKMGSLVTIGITGLVVTFALLGISTVRQVTHQVLNERMMLARQAAGGLDWTFRQTKSYLDAMSRQEALHNPQASIEEINAALSPSSFFARGVFMLDFQGEVIAQTADMQVEWAEMDSVQAALRGESFSLTRLDPVDWSGQEHKQAQTLAVAAVPITGHSGEPIGALATILDLGSVTLFSGNRPFNLGTTGRLDLIDATGHALVSTRPDNPEMPLEADEVIKGMFVAGKPGIETCIGCSGSDPTESSDEVIAFAPLTTVPWGVVVRQKSTELFAPVRRLTGLMIVLSLGALLGAGVLVWLTTNSVIQPVQALTEEVQRLASGDFSESEDSFLDKFSRSSGSDEIQTLASSFIGMRQQLNQSMAEIQALNRDLDARVNERTQAAIEAQKEAQRAQADLRAVIDALTDELIVISVADRRIEQMNRAAFEIYGEPEEGISPVCYEICHCIPPGMPSRNQCPVNRVLETGQPVQMTHTRRGENDQVHYVDIVASPLRNAAGEITRVVELTRDVTEDRRLRESLVRRNQQLSIFNAISRTVNQSLDLKEILDRALNEVLNLAEIDAGAVFLVEEAIGALKLAAYQGLSEDAATLASQMGLLDGACGGVIETGQIMVVPDISRYRGHRARALQKENLNTLVHVPLTVKGSTLGSMCVGTQKRRQFMPEEQALLGAIGSQIAVAVENARLYTEVQRKEQLRGELFRKAINAQEDERKRIARELHDDTSQSLTALLFAVEEGLELQDLNEIKDRLSSMHSLTQRTLDGVHKLIFDLRPSMLDHLGLVPALRWFASSRLAQQGVRVTVEEATSPRRLPPEVETAIFRVVQEAVNNIYRHSGARNAAILFQTGEAEVTVTVEDDGIGFDLASLNLTPDNPRGLGLVGMQERIELLGGELELDSTPGLGTRLVIRVPWLERNGVYEPHPSLDR